MHGLLLVDKQRRWTSHDVVAKLRGITKIRKIGHAGTLDPLATGLLVVGVGSATKRLTEIAGDEKSYLATVRLGATTDTDDAEGAVTETPGATPPSVEAVRRTLADMQGKQLQMPPAYAAIKSGGRKLYQLARAGKDVPREPRPAEIKDIELLRYKWPEVEFRTTVSKGTYIRSIARDLGETLGVGGYLASLRRESVGKFFVENAVTLEQLQEHWERHLHPVE